MSAKKSTVFILGLVALVLGAAPAFASADQLTDPEGVIPVETEIQGTSTDLVLTTAVGELACEHVEVGGVVSANSGGTFTIKKSFNFEDVAENCVRRTPLGEEAIALTPVVVDIHGDLFGTKTASVTYVAHFPSLGLTCHLEGVIGVKLLSASLHAEGTIGGTSGAPCPVGAKVTATYSFLTGAGSVTFD